MNQEIIYDGGGEFTPLGERYCLLKDKL